MPIPLSIPVSQPAANLTAWWLQSITYTAPSPTAQAIARAAMRNRETGSIVTVAIGALISAIQAVAAQRGLL